MVNNKVVPGNFRRVEFEVKIRMPFDTEELQSDSDILIDRLVTGIIQMDYPFATIGKFKLLRKSDLFLEYPEKTREYRVIFFADITKV